MTTVNKGIRIINLGIDLMIIGILSAILSIFAEVYVDQRIIFLIVFLCYYISTEYISSQTLGKIITKTKVVTENKTKPSFGRIILRTILRLNPFDFYSYLFGTEIGAHDSLSKTLLIEKTSAQQRLK